MTNGRQVHACRRRPGPSQKGFGDAEHEGAEELGHVAGPAHRHGSCRPRCILRSGSSRRSRPAPRPAPCRCRCRRCPPPGSWSPSRHRPAPRMTQTTPAMTNDRITARSRQPRADADQGVDAGADDRPDAEGDQVWPAQRGPFQAVLVIGVRARASNDLRRRSPARHRLRRLWSAHGRGGGSPARCRRPAPWRCLTT